jgi:hypothetical protein
MAYKKLPNFCALRTSIGIMAQHLYMNIQPCIYLVKT